MHKPKPFPRAVASLILTCPGMAGSVIKGWDIGVASMLKGEKSLLICEADYAYGERGSPPKIPAGATLHFEARAVAACSVVLLGIKFGDAPDAFASLFGSTS